MEAKIHGFYAPSAAGTVETVHPIRRESDDFKDYVFNSPKGMYCMGSRVW